MIATLAEIKTLTGLDSSYDTQITALIPIVQNYIIDYTGNKFEVTPKSGSKMHKLTGKYLNVAEDSDVDFSAANKTITASPDLDYESFAVASGKDITVTGSNYNDGIYSVASVSSNVITVNEDLNDETMSNYVTVRIIKFPESLKLIAAQIIKHWLLSKSTSGLQSERFDDYSASYSGDLPSTTIKQLNAYRQVKFV